MKGFQILMVKVVKNTRLDLNTKVDNRIEVAAQYNLQYNTWELNPALLRCHAHIYIQLAVGG
jgi:hypothetical protein